jgi:hypothetical protein
MRAAVSVRCIWRRMRRLQMRREKTLHATNATHRMCYWHTSTTARSLPRTSTDASTSALRQYRKRLPVTAPRRSSTQTKAADPQRQVRAAAGGPCNCNRHGWPRLLARQGYGSYCTSSVQSVTPVAPANPESFTRIDFRGGYCLAVRTGTRSYRCRQIPGSGLCGSRSSHGSARDAAHRPFPATSITGVPQTIISERELMAALDAGNHIGFEGLGSTRDGATLNEDGGS